MPKPERKRKNGSDRREDNRQHDSDRIDQYGLVGGSDRTLWIEDIHCRTIRWNRWRGSMWADTIQCGRPSVKILHSKLLKRELFVFVFCRRGGAPEPTSVPE